MCGKFLVRFPLRKEEIRGKKAFNPKILSVFRYISRSGNSHYACSTCQETGVTNAHAYQCENPDDELNVVDSIEADEDDTGNEVLLILNLNHCLDTVPETDRGQGHHCRQDVPILKPRS